MARRSTHTCARAVTRLKITAATPIKFATLTTPRQNVWSPAVSVLYSYRRRRFTYDIHGGVNVTASPVSSSEEARKQRQPPILTIPGSKTRKRRRERAMPLFKSSPKSPQELAKGLKEALGVLSSGGAKRAEKAAEEAAKILGQIKVMLYGSGDQEPQPELTAQLAQEFYNHDILLHLINNMAKLDFEVVLLFLVLVTMCGSLHRRLPGEEGPGTDLQQRPPSTDWDPLSNCRVLVLQI
jgi:hypothetical protein